MRLIVYVGFAQPDEWESWAGTYARHARRFEIASEGAACIVAPFGRCSIELMSRLRPEAVVLSGFARSFEQYDIGNFFHVIEWIDSATIPILALCGSHQLLGFHYNRELRRRDRLADEPMRRLRSGEPVLNPDYHPDYFMERGFYPLHITEEGRSDPLFAGLDEPVMVYESHYCEVKDLPPGFHLLGSTDECRVQAMRHESRPLFGVQFHPEDYNERFPAGSLILRNFFQLRGASPG